MGRILASGNEAAARAAWEAGATVGVAYPGTPSTQALERFAECEGVRAEWAANEKVALEVAAGASLAGARSLVTMKHVGVNVAADALMTLAYTGVGAGLVIWVADDPGMHSSQNEQDSRNWGPFACVPVLEPSDPGEAYRFTHLAFEMSERFDVPVIVRSTTRISHAKSLVDYGKQREVPSRQAYATDPAKWVMMPAMARARRVDLDRRIEEVAAWADGAELSRLEMRDASIGVITSGVPYLHVREAVPDASTLKIGCAYPLPEDLVRRLASQVDRVYVVEEADGYLSRAVRALGVVVEPLDIPAHGELTPGIIARAFGTPEPELREPERGLPPRPPLMCPGCPHRPVFHALRRVRAVVTGDIGCYTLGALPPLAAMDTCVCMGASIGMAHGAELAGGMPDRPVVGVIGDSTFAHTGIPSLLTTAYNGGCGTILILDNRITAMTGHQGNPVVGLTLQGTPSREVDLEELCRALGAERVRTLDPHDVAGTLAVIKEEVATDDLSVIVFRAPCALLVRDKGDPYAVDDEDCTACGACIQLGCPAIAKETDGKASIDVALCVGCAQCVQVCRFDAIVHTGPACDLGGV